MTDLELVELMQRYEDLKFEYEQFLISDYCRRIEGSGNNTPTFLSWIRDYRETY
jgi:hypothetical protein